MFKKIIKNIDDSKKQKDKIRDFRKTRIRMINMMINNGKISDFRLVLIENFLTFFRSGNIKTGPGTFASFLTIILWFLITIFFIKIEVSFVFESLFWAFTILFITFYSINLIPIYTRNFNEDDHPSIVIDEVVGQLIALCLSYPLIREFYQGENWLLTKIIMFGHMLMSFLFFRTFDIAKPFLIGWVDDNIKNPFGVMLDDILAGLLSAFFNILLFLFYKNSILELHGLY